MSRRNIALPQGHGVAGHVRRAAVWLLAAGPMLAGGSGAAAQSLFSTSGLGVPMAALDGRSAILGGGGVGLLGPNTSMVNPAELAGLRSRWVAVAIQPTSRSVDFGGQDGTISGTRFPLMRLMYPINQRSVVSLGYGGFLDQSWSLVSEGSLVLSGDTLRTRDLLESSGGVAQLRLEGAYQLAPTLSVGAGVGLYTGSLARELVRTFPDAPTDGIRDFQTRAEWTYSGPMAVAGLRWEPSPIARLGASITWSGTLEAKALEDEVSHRFSLPLQADLGASGYAAPGLLVALGGRWSGWSSAAADFTDAPSQSGARDAWRVGGGVEWERAATEDRILPVRAGFRYGKLPFPLRAGTGAADASGAAPTEWAIGIGVGVRMLESVRAAGTVVDVGLERGGLTTDLPAVDEAFWRLTVSLGLFGR